MKLFTTNADHKFMTEVIRDKSKLCFRVFFDCDYLNPKLLPEDTTECKILGRLLKPTEVENMVATGAAELRTSKILGSVAQDVSTVVRNFVHARLTHERFGDKTFVWAGDHIIDLDVLYTSSLWSDLMTLSGTLMGMGTFSVLMPAFDKFAHSQLTKADADSVSIMHGRMNVFDLFIPSSDSGLEDLIVSVNTNPEYPQLGIALKDPDPSINFDPSRKVIDITGPNTVKAGECITLGMSLLLPKSLLNGAELDIYIKSRSGYLPKQVVRTVNQKASFKVRALDLDAGDVIVVKAGFKTVSGLSSFEVKVI